MHRIALLLCFYCGMTWSQDLKAKAREHFWNNFSDATDVFVLLSNCSTKQALENTFATVQKFTVLAYDKSSSEANVDKDTVYPKEQGI